MIRNKDTINLGLEIGEFYLIKNTLELPSVATWSETFNAIVDGIVVEFVGGIKVKLLIPSDSSKHLLRLGLQNSYKYHNTPGEIIELTFNKHLVFTKL